jgi:hypothetical protein
MKIRSLVYDAACSVCTDVAQQAEAEANGWLCVRPLQDEEMRALLATHAPGLGRRPALVTQDGDRVTVDIGWTMLAKLALGVGPRHGWRLLRKLEEARPQPAQSGSSARRHLLRAFGGGTLATLSAVVMANPAQESDDEATLVTNEAHDAAIATVRGEARVQVAEQQLLGLGFQPSTEGAVVLRSKLGDQLTMVFYTDASGRPDRAGVMVHERSSDGTTRVLVETLQADPKGLFDPAGRYRQGALQTLTSIRIAENGGVVVPTSAAAYFSCMFGCLGVTCGRAAATCTRLPFLALALACIVGFCGARARSCHSVCRRAW